MAAFSTVAMLALAGAGMGISAVSSIKQGNAAERAGAAQRAASESQADLADFNANVAELQAKDAIELGVEEESQFRQSVRGMIGAQRADIGASGVDVGYGSALDVAADAAYLGELDALTIRTNAARAAWGYRVEAADSRKRAEIARKEGVYLEAAGREAKSASRWQAAGTIAGGTGSLLEARYGFSRRSA